MKQLIFGIIILFAVNVNGQNVPAKKYELKDGKIIHAESVTVKKDSTFVQEVDGVKFWKGAKGGIYYWKQSKKGTWYKVYVPKSKN